MFWIPAFAGMTIIELLKKTPTTGGLLSLIKKLPTTGGGKFG
jgi:hypothetical protein